MIRTTFALLLIALAAASISAQDRLPVIPADKLTEAQKKAAADYKAIRGVDLAGATWSVILRVPDLVAITVSAIGRMSAHSLNLVKRGW
jgi:hypothetical protein